MAEAPAPTTVTVDSSSLSPALLAERVQHERELRMVAERAIEHERELRAVFDAHERELRMQANEAVEKARQIQFDEYERRLTTLNHAHEQAVEAQRTTVPRETFEAYQKESRTALDIALKNIVDATAMRAAEVDRRIATLEDISRENAGRVQGSSSTIRWAFAAIGTVATILGIATLLIALVRP